MIAVLTTLFSICIAFERSWKEVAATVSLVKSRQSCTQMILQVERRINPQPFGWLRSSTSCTRSRCRGAGVNAVALWRCGSYLSLCACTAWHMGARHATWSHVPHAAGMGVHGEDSWWPARLTCRKLWSFMSPAKQLHGARRAWQCGMRCPPHSIGAIRLLITQPPVRQAAQMMSQLLQPSLHTPSQHTPACWYCLLHCRCSNSWN